jgi:ubiquinone/menaquinone biosynthesis C-methylase UbiE
VKQFDIWEGMNRFYAEKWQRHSGYWREHYPPALLVYAVSLYDRRNMAILSHVPDGLNAVLDIGCGVGDVMHLLTKKAKLVYGIDIARINVQKAHENLSRSGIKNAVTVQAPAEWLPFSAGEFDLVVIGDVIEHVLEVDTVLREIKRVLRPGQLLICVTPRKNFLHALEKIDHVLQCTLLWPFKRQQNTTKSFHFERFLSKHELAVAFKRAGFVAQYYRPICFYPGPEGGGTLVLLMRFLYKILGVQRANRLSGGIIRLFDFIERLRIFNQKQMWVVKS